MTRRVSRGGKGPPPTSTKILKAKKGHHSRYRKFLLEHRCTHLSLNILAVSYDYYLKFSKSPLHVISFQKMYNSQNLW